MDSEFIGLEPLEPRLLMSASVSAVDDDGDLYTVKLTGPGDATVVQNDLDGDGRGGIDSIQLTGTSARSVLKIIVRQSDGGDGTVQIGSITGDGLRAIKANQADLVGTGINLTGNVRVISVRDTLNGADILAAGTGRPTKINARSIGDDTRIDLESVLKRIVARDIGQAQIEAPRAGAILVKGDVGAGIAGDFGAEVDLTDASAPWTLKKLLVSGSLIGADIRVIESIRVVRASTAVDSIVFAGIDEVNTTLPDSESKFTNKDGRIRSFVLTGLSSSQFWIEGTYVAAWNIGRFAVGFANPVNEGSQSYGAAMGDLGFYSYRDSEGRFTSRKPANEDSNDPATRIHIGDYGLRFI